VHNSCRRRCAAGLPVVSGCAAGATRPVFLGMKTFLLVLSFAAAGIAQTKTADIDNGKRLFERNGCYQCHGHAGQGGLAGAWTGADRAAFIANLRNPSSGGMPPFRAKIMSD
jgi:mono/diheme cytochrome c family protein